MAFDMLEKILECENTARIKKDKCKLDAEEIIKNAESTAKNIINEAKTNAEEKAAKAILEAEKNAEVMIEEKLSSSKSDCDKLYKQSEALSEKCTSIVLSEILK